MGHFVSICFNEIANKVVRVMKEFYCCCEYDRLLRLLFVKTGMVWCYALSAPFSLLFG